MSKMKYKVTATSAWVRPLEFYALDDEELKALVKELKDQQYGVQVEELNDSPFDDPIDYHISIGKA